jgi:glycosyltransferase involved in cell wall biosynthesis
MTAPVVHLRSSIGLYGAEHMLLGLCGEQARRGSTPVLAAFAHHGERAPDLLDTAASRGLQTIAIPCRGPIDLRCVDNLRTHLAQAYERGARILHCHDYKSVVYGRMASSGSGLRRVATMHGWLHDHARLRLYRALELRLLRGFERVCAVSGAIAEELAAAGVDESRVRCIDNGIDVERFRLRDRTSQQNTLKLGTAARLSPEKNLDQLIFALSECRTRDVDVELVIHGEGPLRENLQALVQKLGLGEVVKLAGNCASLEDWYPQLDAFVLPSLSEGMPLTVLEALSCGCPVLASDVGALPRVLENLPGCRVLPAGDHLALADAIAAQPRREKSDECLRQRVIERYSVSRMADAYEQVYDEALAA